MSYDAGLTEVHVGRDLRDAHRLAEVRGQAPVFSAGTQAVAVLPSTAAPAYMPGSSDDALAGVQRAALPRGREVGAAGLEDDGGALAHDLLALRRVEVIGAPEVSRTVVWWAPSFDVVRTTLPGQPRRVTPSASCGGSIGSRRSRSSRSACRSGRW
ncbi:hypothetical protein SMD44_08372 [Streptomyces alboflavus]|uniref:Uncharacterized protein n=1 Tax=Streptomyces alboflavus TaxID=67267 RepID=A0A1Z1WR30_9ACTN|nr:hypothetical protein SMD44_08372 [Streptomyces alboflavus]